MFAREEPQNEELNSLESALRTLKPAAASLDRDQIMYLAGQTSVQPAHGSFIRRTAWPLATAASVMLAALLGRVTAPEQVHVVDRVVQIPAGIDKQQLKDDEQFAQAVQSLPRTTSSFEPAFHTSELPLGRDLLRPYVRLRDQVVALGPDMLPALGGGDQARAAAANSYGEMRQDLIQ